MLACVAVVLREQPQVFGLAHVARQIDAFLDYSSDWTVERACDLPSLDLVRRILARDALEPPESLRRDPAFKQWQFSNAMWAAVPKGDVKLVQGLVGLFPGCRVYAEAVGVAASVGNLPLLLWLYEHYRDLTDWSYQAVFRAMRGNHLETAKWLQKNPFSAIKSIGAAGIAVKTGNLEMVKWVVELEEVDPHNVLYVAVKSGNLEILAYLLQIYKFSDGALNLDKAAGNGHLNMLRWMFANYKDSCNVQCGINRAAEHGHLDVLQWLHENALGSCTAGAMDGAAGNGHLDVVKWLHANRDEGCTHEAMDLAAKNGFIDVVRWLHFNRAEGCSADATDGAAENGHLEIVRWLHENRLEGCTTEAVNQAASFGHRTAGIMDRASKHGHLAVVQWLHTNRTEGCTFRAMDGAASRGHLDVVKWLHENRSEGCTQKAMSKAAENGHIAVVKWLHLNRTEGCREGRAIDTLTYGNYIELVQWLRWNDLDY